MLVGGTYEEGERADITNFPIINVVIMYCKTVTNKNREFSFEYALKNWVLNETNAIFPILQVKYFLEAVLLAMLICLFHLLLFIWDAITHYSSAKRRVP